MTLNRRINGFNMGRKLLDLSKQTFGKWKVVEYAGHNQYGQSLWACVCECGVKRKVLSNRLLYGKSKSCGKCNSYLDKGTHMVCIVKDKQEFMFDKADLEVVEKHTWFIHKHGYPTTEVNGKMIKLHRMLLNPSSMEQVDHIDLNRKNNCRQNLRVVMHMQNMQNKSLFASNTSGYKGVSWMKNRHKFRAYICINNKLKSLGDYNSAEEAAQVYNINAMKYYGEYARLNPIGNTEGYQTISLKETFKYAR